MVEIARQALAPFQTQDPRRTGASVHDRIPKEKIMQVQVNTDHHIKGHEALVTSVRATLEKPEPLQRSITRVEVHVSDENGDKQGQNDKRCVMEARRGRQPVAVTHQAATVDDAID